MQDDVDVATSAVISGRHAIVPTGRWYMLCCDAANNLAVSELHKAKQRSASNPPLFVIEKPNCVSRFFKTNKYSNSIADKLWPAGVAVKLEWITPDVCERFDHADVGYGLAIAPGGLLADVSRRSKRPLAASSANFSEAKVNAPTPPAITAEEARTFCKASGLGDAVLLDRGIQSEYAPLTLLDCRAPEQCDLVRMGVVHPRALNAAFGEQRIHQSSDWGR